jgi:hypothetical protein
MPRHLALLGVLLAAFAGTANADCLPSLPSVVRLSGVLQRSTFAGPPNFESIRSGDQPQSYFVFRLQRSVCVQDPSLGRISSKRLQLLLEPAQYAQYRPHLGRKITISGQLWPAETASHHTPLMFTPANTQDGL